MEHFGKPVKYANIIEFIVLTKKKFLNDLGKFEFSETVSGNLQLCKMYLKNVPFTLVCTCNQQIKEKVPL